MSEHKSSSYNLYLEFENLVIQILIQNNFIIENLTQRNDKGYDIYLQRNDLKGIAEIKLQRNKVANLDLIKRACQQLILSSEYKLAKVPVLIIGNYVKDSFKKETKKKFGILIWDLNDLIHLAYNFTDEYYKLEEILYKAFSENVLESIIIDRNIQHQPINDFLNFNLQHNKEGNIIELKGRELCLELNNVKVSKENTKFEIQCTKVLKYLFEPDLELWNVQNKTEDTLHKFDLLCRVRPTNKNFWQELLDDFRSRYIVFEFKNYKDKISQDQIYSTEKYLYTTALRSVSFIIARHDANDNAYKAASGALKEHGKLIIILNLKNLCEMLQMKDDGNDPAEFLRNKIDDVLIKMAR